MGKPILESKLAGECFICKRPFPRGAHIWWERADGKSRAAHILCYHNQTPAINHAPATAALLQEDFYLFTDRDGKSKFDLLKFPDVNSAMEMALRISVDNECQPVVVCRLRDGKPPSPLLMVAGVKGAHIYEDEPEPEPELPADGPLFEWDSNERPWGCTGTSSR